MKKIIRIASVIVLASASLLYVGCTKDFSADIAKTNQDVAALNQKVEALDATVQTINSTVANLQTTKADLSAVNAADQALDGKITALDGKLSTTKEELNAAIKAADQKAADAAKAVEAAAAKAAEDLKVAKDSLNGVIKDIDAKIDSLNAISVAKTDSLRKDVDSLYANCAAFEKRIATLEGKVSDIAARVSSIVAVPSMNKEFQRFVISDIDTMFFAATFAVTPKSAVKDIKAENLTVNFKEGLTRAAGQNVDTTYNVVKVVADEAKGEITAFVAFDKKYELYNQIPGDYDLYLSKWDWQAALILQCDWDGDGVSEEYFALPHESAVYYSLSFAGEDKAGKYEENSEYVKTHPSYDYVSTNEAIIVKNGAELAAEDAALEDTLAFDGSEGTKFASLFRGLDVAFKFNDKLISKEDIAVLLDTTFKVVPDTASISARYGGSTHTPYAVNDSTAGIVVTRDKGTNLCSEKEDVGNWVLISISGVKINGAAVNSVFSITEKHWVGAKTVTFTLPAVTEPWTYTSADSVSRTVSITGCADVQAVVPTDGIVKGAFKIAKDSGNGVDIVVTNAKRNAAAKDTVYNVVFEQKANIAKTTPDTVNITINWKYTLEGRPADKTIALADVDTLANDYTQSIELAIDSKIVDKTFAAFDAAYDKTIDSAAVTAAIKSAEAKLDSVAFNGKKVSGAELNENKTAVVLPALSKAGAYSVILNKTVFGIKYTYTYTINLAWKEALKLHATPYVSAGVAVVDADTTAADGVYTLKEMDMAKYLQVFNADTLAKGFTGYTVKFKAELEDSAKFANEKKDTTRGSIALSTNEVDVANGVLGHAKLDWSNYKGREVKVTATLVNSKDTVDTYTFTLKYNKPVTSFTAGTQTIKRVAGKDASAVLSKSFNIKGLYNGNKNLIVDTTGAWVNGKNNYDCEISFDITKATFKVDGVATEFAENVDYVFNNATDKNHPEAATIKFIGDNNNKPIEASIPVVLTYKYDYNHVEAYKDNVVIKVVNE